MGRSKILFVLFVTPNNILNRTLDRRSGAQGGGQGCIYILLVLLSSYRCFNSVVSSQANIQFKSCRWPLWQVSLLFTKNSCSPQKELLLDVATHQDSYLKPLLHLGGNHVTSVSRLRHLQSSYILIGSSISLFSWLDAENNVSLGHISQPWQYWHFGPENPLLQDLSCALHIPGLYSELVENRYPRG